MDDVIVLIDEMRCLTSIDGFFFCFFSCLNPLPNNTILNRTKLKAFADDKFNEATVIISLIDRKGNTVGKGGNAGYQHVLLFLQCFPKPSFLRSFTHSHTTI